MAYQTQSNNQRRNQEKEIIKLNKPLHVVYQDKQKVYLEGGEAYQIAEKLGEIPPHQLRKILNQVKEAVMMIKKDKTKFEEARNKLYYIVPLTAYNTGRNSKLNPLYEFVVKHINENSIRENSDIEVLDQLFTSIIAYHKLKSAKKREDGGK